MKRAARQNGSRQRIVNDAFHRFAQRASALVGSPWAFIAALAVCFVWAATGPLFHYSDTWQLVINTSTTIVTFLMVFLVQNTQNRDALAIHLKLDELLRAVGPARTELVNLESLSDEELERLQREFERLKKRAEAVKGVREERQSSGTGTTRPRGRS